MPRQIRDDQAPALEVRLQLREVPGRPTEAVHEEQRRAFAAHEGPDTGAAMLVDPLGEPGQKIFRIRHVDRLLLDHYELDGDQAGKMKSPALRLDQLEIQAR